MMYTYDFNNFFSFKVWLKNELSVYDTANMGMNAYDDLVYELTRKSEDELDKGYIKEVK